MRAPPRGSYTAPRLKVAPGRLYHSAGNRQRMRAFALVALAPFAATRSPRQWHPDALIPDEHQITVEASVTPQQASPKTVVHTPPAATPGAAEDLVRRWEGRACRNVFAASLDTARPKFDAASGILVPGATRAVRTSKTSGGELDEIGVRHVTWEDTLDWRNISVRPADGRLLDVPRATCQGPPRFCEHAGVPLSVGSLIRPVRGIFHRRNRSLFTVPIEKSASTSIKSLFGYRLLHGCPHTTAHQLFDSMANSTACDFAGTYAWQAASERIALVRDPIRRFLSSLIDHGKKLECDVFCARRPLSHPHSRTRILEPARRRLRELRQGRFEMRLFPPGATIHQYTQSYFLSGTDATGVPVKWTRIIKLESATDDAMPDHLRLPLQNAKADYGNLVEMVRADAEIRCGICDIYRQDFVCLGYQGCEGCTGGLPMELV